MEKESKKPLWERGADFFKRLHIAIGAVALGGYLLVKAKSLELLAAWEGLHAVVIEGVKRFIKGRNRPNISAAH